MGQDKVNDEKLVRELMTAAGNNFAIVYLALCEAAGDSIQAGPVNTVNKEKVLATIARIRNENELRIPKDPTHR